MKVLWLTKGLQGLVCGTASVLFYLMNVPFVIWALKELNKIAEERGQSLAQMALAWVLKDTRVTSVIVGASSVNQLANSLQSISNTCFSEEEVRLIDSL